MIELSKKWAIESGPQNHDYSLVERREGRNRKSGEPTVTEKRTYHPTLSQIYDKLVKSECIDALDASENLQELIDTLNQVKQEIMEHGSTK